MPALPSAQEARLLRYQQLLSEFAEQEARSGVPELGRQKRFAEQVGLSPKYLGHVHNGRRNIGNALARSMEKAFGKPVNWMDSPSNPFSAGPNPKKPLEQIVSELALRACAVDPIATHNALLSIIERRS